MRKKGFALIETIIVVVVLSTTLLMVFTTYNSSIIKERHRLYYDDISYIYRANYLKNFIIGNSIDLPSFLNSSIKSRAEGPVELKRFAFNIGYQTNNLIYNNQKDLFMELINFFNVHEMIFLMPDYKIITKCKDSVFEHEESNISPEISHFCNNSMGSSDYLLKSYIRSIGNEEFNNNYILIVTFKETLDGKPCSFTQGCVTEDGFPCDVNCKTYFTWLDTGVSYE